MHSYPPIRMLIGGEWIERSGLPVLNPSDESIIGSVPTATAADLSAAVAAAHEGARVWRHTAPSVRGDLMLRAVALIRERIEEIAHAITLEQGKPLAQARAEVLRGCDLMSWDAGEGRRLYGRVIPAEPGMRHTVIREPAGVVAAFTPWNYPLSSPARKVGGALAAGCSIILKAAEETPAGAMLLARAFMDAGLPPGVLNLVFGDPAMISSTLIAHPGVRMMTFTGSTVVGKQLAELAGRHMKPAIMELGGHAPVIVCEDANPEAAAAACIRGKQGNAGQVCVAPTRFFVHQAVHARFVAAMAREAAALRTGDGLQPASDMGPLTNARRLQAMQQLTADALQRGARLLCGGERIGAPRLSLADDGAGQRAGGRPRDARGALRPAVPDRAGQRSGRGDPPRQQPALRPGRLCLHRIGAPCAPPGHRARGGQSGHQPPGVGGVGNALRRHQGQRLRPRGRHRRPGVLYPRQIHFPQGALGALRC
jgi:succinate-semialdehyde dehydrogenase/glutarate-semialdehyde dehydrogenase